jgi:hypothetical protein
MSTCFRFLTHSASRLRLALTVVLLSPVRLRQYSRQLGAW